MRVWAIIIILIGIAVLYWLDHQRRGPTLDLVIPQNEPRR